MKKSSLPFIRMEAKPQGLTFKAPQSAVDKWDRTIKAKAAPAAEGAIDILGEIGESFWSETFTTASMVKKQLDAMGKSPVRVTLNSPGGDAFEGIAIYNLLRAHPGNVTVNVIGMAASAGSIIAMAGDRIEIGEAAQLMIHSAWGAVMGNHNDMREFADVLEQLSTSVAELYARRSGQPVKDVVAMMEKETWMLGPKAVALGFADVAVADDKKAKNFATPFAQTPGVILAAAATRGSGPVVRLSATSAPNSPSRSSVPLAARKKGVVYL